MNGREQGFLLLTSHLGDPARRVLSVAQLRTLASRARSMEKPQKAQHVTAETLVAIGYDRENAGRIVGLLSDTQQLQWYLSKGAKKDCYPLSRANEKYPIRLRQRLGLDCPGCLWTKGDISALTKPAVALVGSRDMAPMNLAFAEEAGRQAARQGYVLVSGNARGADRAAQEACLACGGQVISVVADSLEGHPLRRNMLYLSEDSFDAAFSAQRALSRNRVIHCLADMVLVAQCTYGKGGTWDGTCRNLRNGWSPVFCYDDGGEGSRMLIGTGAMPIGLQALFELDRLPPDILKLI